MRKFVQITLGTLAVVALSAPTAFANTITPTPTPTVGPLVGGSYQWTYNVVLSGDSTVETGDFFTILDFAGYVPGSALGPAGWAFSTANTGLCPAAPLTTVVCAILDDPSIPNLTWTRTGGNIINVTPATADDLGDFSARSIFNQGTNDAFVSQDRDNVLNRSGEGAAGGTNVPTSPVPEPASMLLLGTGLLALAARARRARRS